MSNFLRSHWLYMLIGFLIVLLAGISYFTFLRLQTISEPPTVPDITINIPPTLTPAPDSSTAEFSFSIDQESSSSANSSLLCLGLTATPSQGTVPFTVTFSAEALAAKASTLLFHFDFGDTTNQTVERLVTATDGNETQQITHTYTDPGNYSATLSIEDENGQTSEPCQTQIQVGGLAQANTTPTPGTSTVAIGGPSLAPTTTQLSPTKQPTTTRTPTRAPTRIPTPTTTTLAQAGSPTSSVARPNVPEAGGFLPTMIAGLGGLLIILLPLLL